MIAESTLIAKNLKIHIITFSG